MSALTATLRIEATADGLVVTAGKAKTTIRGIGDEAESTGKRSASAMGEARSAFDETQKTAAKLIATIGGIAAVKRFTSAFIEAADLQGRMEAQLQRVSRGQQEYNAVLERTREIADSAYVSINSVSDIYVRSIEPMRQLGRTSQDTLDLTEAVSLALVVSSANADGQTRAIDALSKAMQAGNIQLDGLMTLITSAPRFVEALEAALGKTRAELLQMASSGDLTAATLATVSTQIGVLREEVESMPTELVDAIVRLRNQFQLWAGATNQQTEFTAKLVAAVEWLTENLDEVMSTAAMLAKVLATLYGTRLLTNAALYTAALVAQAKQKIINIALARELGIAQQQGFMASLKSIGLVNAALGVAGAALAGWQIGTYLREEFLEVERFGIAMVGGLLKAWERLKAFGIAAWEGIKAAALGAVNVIRTAAANILGALATANKATDPFGIKSGITDKLREMEQQLRPTTSAWDGFKAALGGVLTNLSANEQAIDDTMMDLWEYAGAQREAAESADGLGESLPPVVAGLDSAGNSAADLYTHLTKIADATGDVDAMLRSLTRTLADDATRAQMDYQDNLADILHLELQWMALGPLSEAQIVKLNEARALAGQVYRQDMEALNAETVRAAERAAEESTRAWERFSYDLADAALDGTEGVKRWWKRMIDDMKRQLIQSGLMSMFRSLFNVGGGSGFSIAGGGAGIGFGSLLQMAGGLSGGTGGSMLSNLFSARSWANAGQNLWGGFSQALLGSGQVTQLGSMLGTGMYGPGMATQWAPSALGGVGLAAAGIGGALYGYNRSGNVAGAVGYGALGLGGAGAMMGMASGAGAMAGATGAFASLGAGAAIPIIGWIAAIAALVDMVAGGKLFGTKHRPESSESILSLADGGSASASLTEVRQRSLFRGRSWRTSDMDPGDEAREAAQALYASIHGVMSDAARALATDVPPMIDAAIRTVAEYDKKGRVTATKIFVDAVGRTWEEATAELAASRLSSEAIIATIDAALGTTVQRAIGGTSPGGPGLGGGPGAGNRPGLGGEFDQLTRSFDGVIADVGTTVGEAHAIAERWRHDAELLAEGAQFLLLAASDIRAGAGLLGDDGTLTQITALIEDLQASGETLSATYARVAGSAALLDQALALSGVQIDGTREHFVRLATDITTAAGGLERASALWGNYFDRFYTDEERARFALTQAQASATKEFTDIGLNAADFAGADGMAEFRRLFEAALPTLSAEAIVEWLEAAAALGIVIDATDALNAALGETGVSAAALAEALAKYNNFIDQFRPDPTPESGANASSVEEARRQSEAWTNYMVEQAEALAEAAGLAGVAEADLALIHARAADAIAAARERLTAAYNNFIDQFRPDPTPESGANASSVEEARRQSEAWTNYMVEQAEALAEAAGLAGVAEEDLALIHARAAEFVEQATARIAAAGQVYVDFIAGIWRATANLSAYKAAMADADDWRAQAIATANQHARAAGMAAASEQALALIELRASQLRAQALAQLREETQSLVDQLYGASGDSIGDAFSSGLESAGNAAADYWEQQRRAAVTLQEYLDSMLLGDLSALTPAEQLAEAWAQLNAAVADGDADSATRLADAYLRLLRGHEASGEDYNAGFWSVRELLHGMLDTIGPIPDAVGDSSSGNGYITAAGAEQIAAQNRLELAAQLAAHLADLSGAVGQTVYELMESMGVDLRTLTADLGISLQSITGETVLALVNMAGLLGTNLLDLTGQLGVSLTDMGAGIRELAENTGANLDALTVDSTQALGALANQLGLDLADIATSVGADLGSLADAQSLLNAALAAQIDQLPGGTGDALQPYLDAIVAATHEADANAAIDAMAGYVNTLAPDIRNALAPYFADVFPADALSDLDYLTSINRQTADMATAMATANGLLARIADNAMASNAAAGIPSYAVGTYNVPQTGPAILHAGEMVLPRPMADAMRQGAFGGGGDTKDLEAKLDGVIQRLDKLDRTTAAGAQQVAATVAKTGEISDRNADASRSRHAQAQRRGVTA
ncbi:tape measure protein [Xanthomonadaceae bacterium XH05]|nr:tape measure protein [Xanthomonadaceae bacterium XH05]